MEVEWNQTWPLQKYHTHTTFNSPQPWKSNTITFPIYKHEETEFERKSFAQTLPASKWSIKDSPTGQTDSKSGLFLLCQV